MGNGLVTYQGHAVAKFILCGEHAVVYGIPAIAAPVYHLTTTVTAREKSGLFSISSIQTGEVWTQADHESPFIQLSQSVAKQIIGQLPPLELIIDSQIPPASGFGSGASVATAIVRTLYDYAKRDPLPSEINPFVFESEKWFHKTPSGLDNTVIVHEKPILFVRNQGFEILSSRKQLTLLIANSGRKAATHQTVAAVRKLIDTSPETTRSIFSQINNITETVRLALETQDAETLGSLLTKNHELLQQLDVSSPQLDKLVDTSLTKGAYGAKLTGGGRGGNMITLVPQDAKKLITESLLDAGAVAVYETTL
jgi:mevalonate kinase